MLLLGLVPLKSYALQRCLREVQGSLEEVVGLEGIKQVGGMQR